MTLYYSGNKMKLQKDFSRNIYETLLILEQNNTNKYRSIITLINEIKNMPEDVMEKGNEEIYRHLSSAGKRCYTKLYNELYDNRFELMSVGHRYQDNSFGIIWNVVGKIPHGVKLQAESKYGNGVLLEATPDTCKMVFLEVKE